MIELINCYEIVSVFRTKKEKINAFNSVKLELNRTWAIFSILAPPTKPATHPPNRENILHLTYQIKTSIIAYCKAADKYSTLIFPWQINSLIELGPAQLIL